MNTLNVFLRRFIPRRSTKEDEYSFELLKSTPPTSERRLGSSGRPRQLTRCYTHTENVHITSSKSEIDGFLAAAEIGDQMSKDRSALIGFIGTIESSLNYSIPPCSSKSMEAESLEFSKAMAECQIIKVRPHFTNGVLLECVDSKPLYPYLHYCAFENPSYEKRILQINSIIHDLSVESSSKYGPYDELHAINKTSVQFDQRLPVDHHAGYIVISFKLLKEQTQNENLEKSWLNWSGAREIYKYSPSNWNLRRISLHRISSTRDRRRGSNDIGEPYSKSSLSNVFAYVLLCEFSSIFHPTNRLQALDMCERLKVRNCGYISLYRVKHAYTASRPEEAPPAKTSSRRDRNPMMRGFSQEVAMPEGSSPRIPKLRLREHSLGYDIEESQEGAPDERFHSEFFGMPDEDFLSWK